MSITEDTRQKMIDDYVNHFLSIKELGLKYGINSYSYISKYILGKDTVRSPSNANKLAHKTKSERYEHSEETKKRMSLKHIEYIKYNSNKTAWRKRYSKLEEIFYEWIKDNNIDKKYLIYRQYPIYPYLIDFAFTDIKLAIEIDGTQHQLKKRQESDKRKDDLLLSKGWNVIRIKEKDIRNDCNSAFNIVIEKLRKYPIINYSNVGITKYKREKASRNEYGYTSKQMNAFIKGRKVNRPTKEELLNDFKEIGTFRGIGLKYKITDKSIAHWFKFYHLPYRVKEIQQFLKNN